MTYRDLAKAFQEAANIMMMADFVLKMPSCKDCAREDCEYLPRRGESSRYNCPLFKGVEE